MAFTSPSVTTVFASSKNLKRFLSTEGRDGIHLVDASANVVGVHFQMVKRHLMESRKLRMEFDWPPKDDDWVLLAIAISAGRYNASPTSTSDFEDVENIVLDVRRLNRSLVLRVVRTLLEDESTVKILFDVHQAACWLHACGLADIVLAKCVDAQLAFEMLGGSSERAVDLATVFATKMDSDRSTTGKIIERLLEFKCSVAASQHASASETMPDEPPATTETQSVPTEDTTGFTSMVRLFPMLSFEELRYYALRQAESVAAGEHSQCEASAADNVEESLAQVIAKWYLSDQQSATKQPTRADEELPYLRSMAREFPRKSFEERRLEYLQIQQEEQKLSHSSSPATPSGANSVATDPAVTKTTNSAKFDFGEFSKELPSFAPTSSKPQQKVANTSAGSVFAVGSHPPKVQASYRVLRARSGRRDTSNFDRSAYASAKSPCPVNPPMFESRSTTAPTSRAPELGAVFVFGEGSSSALPTFGPKQSQRIPEREPSCSKTRQPAPLVDVAGPQQHRHGLATSALFSTSTWSPILLEDVDEVKNEPSANSRVTSCRPFGISAFSNRLENVLVKAADAIREALVVLAHMPVAPSPSLFDATERRWSNAVANKGFPVISFTQHTYIPRSAECFSHKARRTLEIGISSDTGALLAVLPPRVGVMLSTHLGESFLGVTDVCLDVGCQPAVMLNGDHKKVHGVPIVTQFDLDWILRETQRQVGSKGSDRWTMPSLHRITALRTSSMSNSIASVTLRVGRVVRNQALLLQDLLFASENAPKSVLVLGLPGSGKSTLLRDTARCVSQKQDSVYVIDTWGDLCGGTADSHKYFDPSTRKITVESRNQQAETIRDCIRNHRVRVLVVDEVETDEEVMALWSAKERGVRLVVGIQGSLAALLQNGKADGNVVRTAVTRRMCGSENLLSQNGHALFQSVVELDAKRPSTVKVMLDFARGKWNGNRPAGESRCFNSSTGAICIRPEDL
jgi:stage III sporulation protein SpoIIIAA